jgi:predicted dinucleotide-binding enzyme
VGPRTGGREWNRRNGQIVVDATNDWAADDLDGRTSSEVVADLVNGARGVKAANTLGADVLGADPVAAGGRRVIFLSGDGTDAKADVVKLFEEAGFAAIDLGDLATGGAMQQIHRPLARPEPDPARGLLVGTARFRRAWA